jgi:coenzyme PQQ precursor peptide PqqA
VRRAALGCGEIAQEEVNQMTWETPAFVEVKMDAEINAYQEDFGRDDSF